MEQEDRTLDRPTDHATGADPAERTPQDRREASSARLRAGYAAALVWALACLALYAWQLIGIAGG